MATPKSSSEIKKGMALPPIPQQAPRVRKDRNRNRSRIRLEISADQGDSFTAMLADKLRTMNVDDADFKQLYGVYFALKSQLEKMKEGAK